MTHYESAIHELAERLQGNDASLIRSIAEILGTAQQELIEAEVTARIGAGHGERIPTLTILDVRSDDAHPTSADTHCASAIVPPSTVAQSGPKCE